MVNMVKAVSYLLLKMIYSCGSYTHNFSRSVCEKKEIKKAMKRMQKLAHEDECKSLHSLFI